MTSFSIMLYRQIGQTGLEVSVVGLGTWQFGDPTKTYQKHLSRDCRAAIVQAALDAGINYFDTAEAYLHGAAERGLGQALVDCGVERSQVVISSKILPENIVSAESIRMSVDSSLDNLKTDYIDLYLLHWPNHSAPIAPALHTLQELQAEGKIRHIGLSNFGVEDMKEAVAVGVPLVANQLPYSLLNRAIENGIAEACQEAGLAVMAYSPMQQGLLSGRYPTLDSALANQGLCRSRLFNRTRSPLARHDQDGCEDDVFKVIAKTSALSTANGMTMGQLATAWVLSRPNVTCAIVGASAPCQVKGVSKATDVTPSAEVLSELDTVSEPVKAYLGTSPDMWETPSRYR